MGDLHLREDLVSCQLVDLVREIVGGSVGLDCELQLGDDLFVDDDLEGDVIHRPRVCVSRIDRYNHEPFLIIFPDELLDLIDGEDDAFHL